jgi:hypothetical protein
MRKEGDLYFQFRNNGGNIELKDIRYITII